MVYALILLHHTFLDIFVHLNLDYNQIEDDEAIALARNTSLTTLSLEGNRIGKKGIIALAGNKSLTTLDFSDNKMYVSDNEEMDTSDNDDEEKVLKKSISLNKDFSGVITRVIERQFWEFAV